MNEQKDVIIVGQGLAGTVLALTLHFSGKEVLIIDNPSITNSSRAAGGAYNPVVFKRLTSSWMAHELLPVMKDFYRHTEAVLKKSLLFERPILKIFGEQQEQDFWKQKANESEIKEFVIADVHTVPSGIKHAGFGSGEVIDAGYLDTIPFLETARQFFMANKMMLEENFDSNQLQLNNNEVLYKNIAARYLIFAEGVNVINNPYFKHIPMKPAKGEVIIVKIPGFDCNKTIHKNISITKVGHELFRVGATYDWTDRTEQCTNKARNELVEKLKTALELPFEIVAQKAGVRPSVEDRRPVIGLHPQYPQLGIFNGMGTKGVMLAPYWANEFQHHLFDGFTLSKDVNSNRFSI